MISFNAMPVPLARHWISLCYASLALVVGPERCAGDGPKSFRAGAFVVDITPTNYPVLVNAMFTERVATNTVDRLTVRSLALDDGSTKILFAVVDTCMVARDLMDQAKSMASSVTGIPTDRMLVSATHTHSAPSAMGCLGSRMDTNYAAFLMPRIAESLIGAANRLQPARIGWGVVDDWDHTFNRRWIRRPDKKLTDPFGDVSVRAHMHPGYQSPDAVGPSGPVDPGLSVVALQTLEGRPLALLANYSQHYYGSPLLSSDYYGRFCQHVASQLGADAAADPGVFVPIMSQGTSGDLMWMDYGAPAKDIGYDAYARAMAESVARLVRGMTFREWVPLAMAERKLALGYRVPDAARLAWARRVAGALEGRLPGTLPEIYALESIYLHERPRTEIKVQAIRIGDVGIATLPNEVYAITGLKLKAQSPFQTTFNIELANGAEGYIPPPEQHKLGGYTTWAARTAGLEVTAEPKIVEALLGLLEEVAGKPRRAMTDSHGTYAKAVLRSKPYAYWRLNEAIIPTAHDASGRGRDASFEDGVALYLPGAGQAVGFHPAALEVPNAFSDGQINRAIHIAGGRLRASLPKLPDSYSIELWVWNGLPVTARDVTGHFYARGVDGVTDGMAEHLAIGGTALASSGGSTAGRLVLGVSGTSSVSPWVGRTELAMRTWHHVVLVREGSSARVYLDGNPIPEIQANSLPRIRSGSMFFGGRHDGVAGLEGKMDEVAVYDRALKAKDITEHFRRAALKRP